MGPKMRITFSCFAVVMVALFVWRLVEGQWSVVNWGSLLIAAVCCLLVFVRFVFIFNFSYGLIMVLNAAFIYWMIPSVASGLMALACILYGLRLFLFTWQRTNSASYAEKTAAVIKADEYFPMPARIALWFQDVWLMAFHLMALYFVALRGELSVGVIVGSLTIFFGTVLEGGADWQKQKAKALSADALVTNGFFTRIRHPNYTGEILVQLGIVTAGLAVVASISDILAVIIAPTYIFILMIAESRRVDQVQQDRCGENTDYQQWRAKSGALLPF
ncbi:MAG: DUF1295 domain-containing protein [Gammaproteobacteria bacterium]